MPTTFHFIENWPSLYEIYAECGVTHPYPLLRQHQLARGYTETWRVDWC